MGPIADKPDEMVIGEIRLTEYRVEYTESEPSSTELPEVPGAVKAKWANEALDIAEAHNFTRGENTVGCVLDTGVVTKHPDLVHAIMGTKSFVKDPIEDKNGHGTHVAGIISGSKSGVAPDCKLYIGKVLGNNGSGSIQSIVAGIRWAISLNVDFISMSLGSLEGSADLYDAVHEALAKRITVLAAVGNDGNSGKNNINYPGKYGSCISIGSHGLMGRPSDFTSRGGEVDFLAPGDNIRSTYLNNGYATLSGTSMGTPFAAGIVSLLISQHRKRQGKTRIDNPEDVRNHLLMMASHPDYYSPTAGYGPLLPYLYFSGPHQ